MFMHGLIGFVIAFILGVALNLYLLRNVPPAERVTNKVIRRKYGLLNWGIAFIGMMIGVAIKTNL